MLIRPRYRPAEPAATEPAPPPEQFFIRIDSTTDRAKAEEMLAKWRETLPEAALWSLPNGRLAVAFGPMDEVTGKAWLRALRNADAVYIDQIRKHGLYDAIWQAFAVLLPVKTVGVMGDARTYEKVLALRAVTSTDGMTADFYPFPWHVLGKTATRIINEVRGVNRVVYDVTSKPPGTIEWE